MPAECTFVLPNGNKCRCLANRGHNLCRHHGAAPPVRSTRPRTDRDADRTYWREMGETIRGRYPDDYPTRMLDLLDALRENRISDRAAGRLLRGLLQLHNPKETPLMSSPDAIGQPAPSASPKSGPPQPAVAALLPPSLRSFASVLPPFSTPQSARQPLPTVQQIERLDALLANFGAMLDGMNMPPSRPTVNTTQPLRPATQAVR